MNAKRLGMVAVVGALGLCGCEAEAPVGVGENEAPVEEQPAEETWPQTWVGYAEATGWFGEGSDQITIVVNEDQTGTVVFGTGNPPAIGADGTYPPEFLSPAIQKYPLVSAQEILKGFPYRLYELAYSELRLEASINSDEEYTSYWRTACPGLSAEDVRICESMSYVVDYPDTNTCYIEGDPTRPIACELAELCAVCTCAEGSCSLVESTGGGSLYIDLSRSGERMDGIMYSFMASASGPTTLTTGVHLVRQ